MKMNETFLNRMIEKIEDKCGHHNWIKEHKHDMGWEIEDEHLATVQQLVSRWAASTRGWYSVICCSVSHVVV